MTPNSTQMPTFSSSTTTLEAANVSKAQVKEHIEALIDALNGVLLGKENQVKLALVS